VCTISFSDGGGEQQSSHSPEACDLLITGLPPALTAQFHRLQNHCIYIQLFCNRLQSSLAINSVENSVALCNMSPDATV
jgi:hypothetical protein